MGEFKDRLKFRRDRLGMDQAKLAEMSGFSASSISAWERGLNSPTVDNLKKLADVLAVPEWWLLGEDAIVPEANDTVPAWARVEITKLRGLAEALVHQISAIESRIGMAKPGTVTYQSAESEMGSGGFDAEQIGKIGSALRKAVRVVAADDRTPHGSAAQAHSTNSEGSQRQADDVGKSKGQRSQPK